MELVVLSACETGMGESQNDERVFGLRRAPQEAGVNTVLISMWAVPDRETQELITRFYRRWLGGQEKHDGLRDAQRELRTTVKARYSRDVPAYWGAFVLVGR
jgi:CHAT domain-containing protein